eukprot:s624_g19.t1
MSLRWGLALLLSISSGQDVAVINLVRHAEKCPGSGHGLTAIGKARASYLARCMSRESSSRVMPLGKARAVMASRVRPGQSTRPRDTAKPLANALGVKLQMPCDKVDASCFAENAKALLFAESTLVVFWQHEDLPLLVEALQIPNLEQHFKQWPKICPSSREPACLRGSMCYDEVWQVDMKRTDSNSTWHATSIRSLHQGFPGPSKLGCHGDLTTTTLRWIVA